MVYDIQRYLGKLYIRAASGLYYLKSDEKLKKNLFEPLLGDFKIIFDTVLSQKKLIVGSNWVSEID